MTDKDILTAALAFHGHKCWASVAGVRVGLAALRALDVARSGGTQLYTIVEIGEEHGGMCFGDGIQYATGCAFGKGNIQKLGSGKFAVTVIDNKTGRRARVVTRNETIQRSKESEFIAYRKRGVPASKIEAGLAEPLVDFVLTAPAEVLFEIGPVNEGQPPHAHDFETVLCAVCGETVVERYARIKGGQIVCMPCAEKGG